MRNMIRAWTSLAVGTLLPHFAAASDLGAPELEDIARPMIAPHCTQGGVCVTRKEMKDDLQLRARLILFSDARESTYRLSLVEQAEAPVPLPRFCTDIVFDSAEAARLCGALTRHLSQKSLKSLGLDAIHLDAFLKDPVFLEAFRTAPQVELTLYGDYGHVPWGALQGVGNVTHLHFEGSLFTMFSRTHMDVIASLTGLSFLSFRGTLFSKGIAERFIAFIAATKTLQALELLGQNFMEKKLLDGFRHACGQNTSLSLLKVGEICDPDDIRHRERLDIVQEHERKELERHVLPTDDARVREGLL